MRVFFNGEPLGGWRRFDATAETDPPVFAIPAALWSRRAAGRYECAVLGFEFPDAAAPARLDASGRSQDQRLLALGFESVRFTAVP